MRSTRHIIIAAVVLLALAGSIGASHAAYETGGVIKSMLNNGLTILVHPEPEVNVAAIEVFIRIGAADETDSNAGIGQLLAGSILSGSKTRSGMKLARLVSEVGGNFHAVWQWNYLEAYAITSPETCEEAIGLLADTILNSTLDSEAIEYAKTALEREARRQKNDPFTRAYAATRKLVHNGSPYDRPYLGNAEKMRAITRRDLQEFYDENVSSDRVVVSVAGNVDPESILRKVEVCFTHMKTSSQAGEYKTGRHSGGELDITDSAKATYVLLGYPAAGVDDPDYPAMSVANVLLGGNKSSLLFTNLREARGLGYQVGSVYPDLKGTSHVVAFLGMDSARATDEAVEEAQELMVAQVEALRSGQFSDDDLERAKRYLIGTHARKHERTRDRAHYLGLFETMGLGYRYDFLYPERVRGVTREDVIRVCDRFLESPARVVLAGADGAR